MRDVISAEMWEALNSFYLLLGRYDLQAALRPARTPSTRRSRSTARCSGASPIGRCCATKARAFLEAGGRIEEADMVLRMLRVAIPPPRRRRRRGRAAHEAEALALLQAVGGFQAYRRAVRQAPTRRPVIRFLLFDSGVSRTRWSASVDALRGALRMPTRSPRSSPPVLRLGRLSPTSSSSGARPAGRRCRELERVRGELALDRS